MKKMLSLILCATMCLSLAACGGSSSTNGNNSTGATSGTATYTINYGHPNSEDSTCQIYGLAFKEYVEEKTNGAIAVNIYPAGQLGSDRECLEAVQNGEITMLSTATAPQTNFIPDLAIWDIPFSFKSVDALRYTYENEAFMGVIKDRYQSAGFHLLSYQDAGFRELTLNKEVHTPADLAGQTIRTMENTYHMNTWKAVGANATPIAYNELYTALQQGTVDGQENPLELIYTNKYYEQQDYVILTHWIPQLYTFVMSNIFYQSLPAEYQTIIDDAAIAARTAAIEFQEGMETVWAKTIEDSGTQIIELSSEELQAFSDLSTGVVSQIKENVSEEVYNAYMQTIDDYAAGNQ